MPVLTYPTPDFVAFTVISSADMNGKLNAIKTLLNTTKLDSTNVQQYGLSLDRLATGTANYAIYRNGSGNVIEGASLPTTSGGLGFNPTLSLANAGKVVGVNDAGNALELRAAEAAAGIVNPTGAVATLTAGEAITAQDAICLVLNEGAYKVFRCDTDNTSRLGSFRGFALNSASVTPEIFTITISPANWTSGSAVITINGRNYTQAFSSNHNTSVDALCSQIAGDPDVLSCVATGSPRSLITVTGEGALTVNWANTGQPTGATFGSKVQTQAPVGGTVRYQFSGFLSGFSGLTAGTRYYTSATTGGVSSTPSPEFVGYAVSSTVIDVNPNNWNQGVVYADYYRTTAQSMAPGATVLNYDTKRADTHSAVTTGASWVFTAPRADRYMVTCRLYIPTYVELSSNLLIKKSGTTMLTLTNLTGNGGENPRGWNIVGIIECAAGDTLQASFVNGSGSTSYDTEVNTAGMNIQIISIGN